VYQKAQKKKCHAACLILSTDFVVFTVVGITTGSFQEKKRKRQTLSKQWQKQGAIKSNFSPKRSQGF